MASLSQQVPQLHQDVNARALVVWTTALGGVILRAAQYTFDRSLWLDESLLALNILRRSFDQLTRPLDFNQAAPLGFLWLQKIITLGWGQSEYALRAAPFVAGIAALLLFAVLARQVLSPVGAVIAVLAFAVSDTLIYYSAEAKQYSTDVLIAVLVLLMAVALLRQAERASPAFLILCAAFGVVAVWMSHPAIFMLAGTGAALMWPVVQQRQWANVARLAGVGAVWVMSFVAFYLLVLQPLSANQALESYWQGGFLSLRPSWLIGTFFEIFSDPLGLAPGAVAAAACVIGGGALLANRKPEAALLLFPIACTLLASALRLYPFSGRLLLFLAPCLLLLVAAGAEFIVEASRRQQAAWAGIVFVGVLFLQPSYVAAYHLFNPRTREEIAPVLAYLSTHAQPGDQVYVDWPSQYPLQYYAERYPLNVGRIISGVESNDLAEQSGDLRQLRGERVWILFSHRDADEAGYEYGQLLSVLLNERSQQLDAFASPGAGVLLYDLSD